MAAFAQLPGVVYMMPRSSAPHELHVVSFVTHV